MVSHSLPADLLRPRPAQLRRERLAIGAIVVGSALGFAATCVFAAVDGVRTADLLLFAAFYLISAIGIEVGFHRCFSHGSFEAKPWLRTALAIAGCTAGQGPPTYWVAHHRRHHSMSDRDGDPHSPNLDVTNADGTPSWRGLLHAHVGWVFGPTRASPARYAKDLLTDPAIRRIESGYLVWLAGSLVLPALLGGAAAASLDGVLRGFLFGGLARLFVVQNAAYATNSLCHRFGRRPHETEDRSGNLWWLWLPTLGGCFHNNHHASPTSARVGAGLREPDPGYWCIMLFAWLGCAERVRLSRAEAQKRTKSG